MKPTEPLEFILTSMLNESVWYTKEFYVCPNFVFLAQFENCASESSSHGIFFHDDRLACPGDIIRDTGVEGFDKPCINECGLYSFSIQNLSGLEGFRKDAPNGHKG